jgi:sulfur-carrier protein
MKVRIPTPLRSYTDQQSMVDAEGRTVAEVLADLDHRYPGLRFRVVDEQGRLRKHMKVFVAQESVRDLTTTVDGLDEVVIMQALSGGA